MAVGFRHDLEMRGEKLWNDTKLSSNGVSCNTCHQGNNSFAASFSKPFPHQVAMAKDRVGMDQIALDEMIQLCLVVPMETKPLAWDSKDLAALAAYTRKVQRDFTGPVASAMNPCAAKNPCAANPCAANPCAAKNPCAGKNPCAAKNPCKGG